MNTKQVIVIRKDLNMRRGKEIAQGAHASMAWLLTRVQTIFVQQEAGSQVGIPVEHRFTYAERAWIEGGQIKKIACQVDSEDELLALHQKALDAGLQSHVIRDAGLTELEEGTATALAIGPDTDERVDAVTGDLKLY